MVTLKYIHEEYEHLDSVFAYVDKVVDDRLSVLYDVLLLKLNKKKNETTLK